MCAIYNGFAIENSKQKPRKKKQYIHQFSAE